MSKSETVKLLRPEWQELFNNQKEVSLEKVVEYFLQSGKKENNEINKEWAIEQIKKCHDLGYLFYVAS